MQNFQIPLTIERQAGKTAKTKRKAKGAFTVETFMTPPGHKNFSAKKLFEGGGALQWGAVAYIQPGGGGPEGSHTHPEDHIFLVTEGEVQVVLGDREVTVKQDESLFVDGMTPHSIWNRSDSAAKVFKLSTRRQERL